jgi:TonB family protein
MTRDKDATVGNANSLREDLLNRVKIAESGNADLFISIHVNADPSNEVKNGFEIWLSARNPYYQQSKALGSVLTEEIKNTYPIAPELRQRQEGTIVLQTPKMPAVLIECGYITNKEDLAFMTNEENQIKIAKDILEGVVKYNNASNNSSLTIKQDTITPFEYSNLKMEANEITETYDVEEVGKNEQIMMLKFKNGDQVVVKGSAEEFNKYVNNEKENKDTSYPKTYSKVEIEADYPGGPAAWVQYLNKNVKYPQEAINNEIQGTVVVQFIVNIDGTVSDIKISKSDNKILNEEVIRIIKNSGNWIPAMQHGKKVRSYKKQPIVFKLEPQKNP